MAGVLFSALVALSFNAPPSVSLSNGRFRCRHTPWLCADSGAENPDLSDWRDFRHRLLVSEGQVTAPAADGIWAHSLTAPEQGCLLIAQPNVRFAGRSPLNQGVVLLLQADNGTDGALGLSLNVETAGTFGSILDDEQRALDAAFGERPLMLGGGSDELDGPRSVCAFTVSLDRCLSVAAR